MTLGSAPVFTVMTLAVPKVFFALPGLRQAWPNIAACWSPSTACTRAPVSPITAGSSAPKSAPEGRISGSSCTGMPSRSQNSRSQSARRRSSRAVREAALGSVAWVAPPVRFHSSQQSMVPAASLPASASARIPSTFLSSQASFAAE